MFNSNRELSKQGGGSSGRSAIPPVKIRRCSPGNGGRSTDAAVVDVEDGLSASPSTPLHSLHQEAGNTNEINFVCNFSKNMILSFPFSRNQSNPACDAMLKLSFQAEPIVTKNYWITRLKRQKRAGLAISPPDVRKPPQSFSSLLASVQLPSRPKYTGLKRSGKNCRSRRANYSRANLNKEAFSVDEEGHFPCCWLLETNHFSYPVQPELVKCVPDALCCGQSPCLGVTNVVASGILSIQPLEATATGPGLMNINTG